MGILNMKKKKEKQPVEENYQVENDLSLQKASIDVTEDSSNFEVEELLDKGSYSFRDFVAPSAIDRSEIDSIQIGNKFVRNFIMQGFPMQTYVGWLDYIYNYDGEMDSSIQIDPIDDKTSLDALTAKITQFEAQLAIESDKGNIRNISRLQDKIAGLYEQRRALERNTEKMFQIQISCNLFANSKEDLNKETQKFDNQLRGRKIYMMPTYLRQEEGFKSTLPIARSFVEDLYRNFNSAALTGCFPFYNSEIYHENGVFIGVNLTTWTPVLIDFYDRSLLNNSNITVLGQAGTGKTFFVSLLTMRSALRGIRTVIIDPEGEYNKLTSALGGSHIYLAPDSSECLNPFDIEEEDILDSDGYPTGIKTVSINDKAADMLNLIGVMAGGLTGMQKSTVSTIIQNLYYSKGITEDPKSLYVTEPYFDPETKVFYHDGKKKPMPTFSDFHKLLEEYARKEKNDELLTLSQSLEMFKKGGIYDMFDCHTSDNISNFRNSPIVTFDISRLEESMLRPIGMYVALSWTWEKFGKKNPQIKKRIVCDEAWMLVNKNMKGSDYTAQFLETTSRRIRKRNGGLLVASQNFTEFAESSQGKAVLTNAKTNIFLGQAATDVDALQDTFKLSDGEKVFLLQAKRGEMLVRMDGEAAIVQAIPFDIERELIEKRKFEE